MIIYVNNPPIDQFSKKHSTVETSTFGVALIAPQIAMEKVKELRTQLQLIGITIDGPNYMFCENESVVKYMSMAERSLSKKHQLIYWLSVREAT